MTTALGRRTGTLSDTLIPYTGFWIDIAIIVAGSLLIAAAAQISIPLKPVPVTGQTFAVLLVGVSAGSRRGGLAAVLYLVEGSAGLPFFADGASAKIWADNSAIWDLATGGYIVGFIPAAFLAGFLAERGWDRGPWLLAAMVVANWLIYIPGLWWLAHQLDTGFNQTLDFGLWPFIAGDLVKIVLVSLTLPAAWSLLSRYDPRLQGGAGRDGNP